MREPLDISILLGQELKEAYAANDEVNFVTVNGRHYRLYHEQDCCESVYVEDISGDLSDLIGSPLLMAEEVSNAEDPGPLSNSEESYTWTFYKFATAKGYVTIRFYGSSNGYYSERVSFSEV